MIGDITSYANIGSFILAFFIAMIGLSQSRKKDNDRVYDNLMQISNLKSELEFDLAAYIADDDNLEIFNNLKTRYCSFVNTLEYFSGKILNQKLYRSMAFKSFQGDQHHGLIEFANVQLMLFRILNERGFDKHGIVSADVTRKSHLKNTYKLLELTIPNKDYLELQKKCKEYHFF